MTYQTTADELTEATRHVLEARIVTRQAIIPLVVSGGSTIWDEQRAPRVISRLDCHVPDRRDLAAIDPRTLPRLELRAGYMRPDGRPDVRPFANLDVRDRDLSPRGLQILASSQETRIADAHTGDPAPPAITATTRAGAIRQLMTSTEAGTASTPWRDLSGSRGTAALDPADRPDPSDRLAAAAAIAALAGLDLYDDGLGVFVLEPRATLATAADVTVTAGVNLVDFADALKRSPDWGNAARVIYTWTETDAQGARIDRSVIGNAVATSGPYAGAPRRTDVARYPGPISQASADATALSLLGRAMSRGHGLRVTTPAPYWARPGMTLAAQLQQGAREERHIIARVTFDHGQNVAHIDARTPDESATTTGT